MYFSSSASYWVSPRDQLDKFPVINAYCMDYTEQLKIVVMEGTQTFEIHGQAFEGYIMHYLEI